MENDQQQQGAGTFEFLAIVSEVKQCRPIYGNPSAEATVVLFDDAGRETNVRIPIFEIAKGMECGERYRLTVNLRKLEPGEGFNSQNDRTLATQPAPQMPE